MRPSPATVLSIQSAELRRGDRTLWSGLNLELAAGECVAVLGANGAGKSSLLRAILGELRLSAGSITVSAADDADRVNGSPAIGYVPQHYAAADGVPIRAGDLIGLAVDGNRFGIPWPSRSRRERVQDTLAEVDATELSQLPVARLSGGQQQRIRIGQALAADPSLLLCDEPFGSLDLSQQRTVAELIERRCREHHTAVLLVTHDVNPVLGMVDRVLYLAAGRFCIGTVEEVMRSEVLSELYGSPVEVLNVNGRLVVLGTTEDPHEHGRVHHHG